MAARLEEEPEVLQSQQERASPQAAQPRLVSEAPQVQPQHGEQSLAVQPERSALPQEAPLQALSQLAEPADAQAAPQIPSAA